MSSTPRGTPIGRITGALLGVLATGLLLVGCSFQTTDPDSTPSSERASRDLCSLDGVMNLVPQTRNAEGQFEIPDPGTDLAGYLSVHQALSRVIDATLAQAAVGADPYSIADSPHRALQFGGDWRSAEVGLRTDGKQLSFPDGSSYASFGGKSFLSGIEPAPGTSDTMYQIPNAQTGEPSALVNAQPTALPCVNRLLLAAANSGGFWAPPTYALGPEGGDAFLIVDLCIDLANPTTIGDQSVLGPAGSLFVALQWADSDDLDHMRTDQESHLHGGPA